MLPVATLLRHGKDQVQSGITDTSITLSWDRPRTHMAKDKQVGKNSQTTAVFIRANAQNATFLCRNFQKAFAKFIFHLW